MLNTSVATVANAFNSAATPAAYNRAKRLACKLTGSQQLAIVDAAIDASLRLAQR